MLRLSAALLLLLGLIWSEGRAVTAPAPAPALSTPEDGATDPTRPDAVAALPATPADAVPRSTQSNLQLAHENVVLRGEDDKYDASSPRGPPALV